MYTLTLDKSTFLTHKIPTQTEKSKVAMTGAEGVHYLPQISFFFAYDSS